MTRAKVDRTRLWTFADFHHFASETSRTRVWENPKAQAITEIDFSDIELLPILKNGPIPMDLAPAAFKKEIENRLRDYEAMGYVLLDGAVAVTMLRHPHLLPPDWKEMTDSDTCTAKSAAIRFDGSVYRLQSMGSTEFVVSPFVSRGTWGFGFTSRIPELPKPERRNIVEFSPEFTAAIKLES